MFDVFLDIDFVKKLEKAGLLNQKFEDLFESEDKLCIRINK